VSRCRSTGYEGLREYAYPTPPLHFIELRKRRGGKSLSHNPLAPGGEWPIRPYPVPPKGRSGHETKFDPWNLENFVARECVGRSPSMECLWLEHGSHTVGMDSFDLNFQKRIDPSLVSGLLETASLRELSYDF
jgi:hypothetical protein